MSEQVYFALSPDGRHWEALGGEPILISTLGERGVRDPFLLRSHDGKHFYLLATDLSINLNPDWKRAVHRGSRSLVIWKGTRGLVMDRVSFSYGCQRRPGIHGPRSG